MKSNVNIYRVFISHAWNYRNEYYKLEKMLDDSPEFRWQNIFPGFVSPKKDIDDELEKSLRTQIGSCDVVLVISDIYNKDSTWIEREMNIAIELNKPIIGLSCRSGDETPWEIRRDASEIIDWNGFELTNAIQRYSNRAAFKEDSVSKLLELSWGSP